MIGIIDFNDWELVITNDEPVRNKKHYAAAAKGPEEMQIRTALKLLICAKMH